MRFDIEISEGAARATFVRKDGVPAAEHAPIRVDADDDVVAVARKLFAAGLPQ
jgi:predicted regulator of Ras-like GTPase activity (Roadblock/LC7/MglB family)